MNTSDTKPRSKSNAVEWYGSTQKHRTTRKQRARVTTAFETDIVKESARIKASPRPSQQVTKETSIRSSKKKKYANIVYIYKASPSTPSSYKAKKIKCQSVDIEKIILANINECKAKLTECNNQIRSQQDIAKVPVTVLLQNILTKMYGANENQFLKMSLFRWKQQTHFLRQKERSLKQTAKTVKSMAQEIVRYSIDAVTKKMQLTIKDTKNQDGNIEDDAAKIQRWYRSRSMYKMYVDFSFDARGSLFRLPDLTKYNSKCSGLKK